MILSRRIYITCIASVLMFASCGNEDSGETASDNDSVSANSEQTQDDTQDNTGGSPCDLFTLEDVTTLFAIGEDTPLSVEDEVLTYPTCTYSWEDGKVTHTIMAGEQAIETTLPSKLMIVMVNGAIEVDYNTSIRVYKDAVAQNGIGKMSTWSSKRSQLTFLAKGHLFHVHAKISNDDEENKTKATEVAKSLISKL